MRFRIRIVLLAAVVAGVVPATAQAGTIVYDNFDLYTIPDTGGTPTRVTRYHVDRRSSVQPRWSPDGTRIVFAGLDLDSPSGKTSCQVSEAGCPFQIWTINADGTGAKRLTATTGRNAQPDWSADGSQITFIRGGGMDRHGVTDSGDVWVMNADGSGARNVTRTTVGEYNPHFRPDGRIEFSHWNAAQGSADVYLVKPDGTGRVTLTGGDFAFYSYAFSPDGSRLAWGGALRYNAPLSIYTMDAHGADLTARAPLSLRNTGGGAEVTWSPDSSALAYVSEDSVLGDFNANIFRVPVAGGTPFDVTRTRTGPRNPDWFGTPAPVASAAATRPDRVPPAIRLTSYRSRRDGLITGHATSLEFLAVDKSGIRTMSVAITRRGDTPRYVRVRGLRDFRALLRRKRAGRYVVRWRATDVRGNATTRPRVERVRLLVP